MIITNQNIMGLDMDSVLMQQRCRAYGTPEKPSCAAEKRFRRAERCDVLTGLKYGGLWNSPLRNGGQPAASRSGGR